MWAGSSTTKLLHLCKYLKNIIEVVIDSYKNKNDKKIGGTDFIVNSPQILKSYFNSPMAYIFLVIFAIINGYFFTRTFFLFNQSDMRSLFNIIPLVYLFFIPAVTMSLISREKSIGTMGENTADILFNNDTIVKNCNKFFNKHNIPYKIRIKKYDSEKSIADVFEFRILDTITKTDVHISDTGY